MHAQEDGAAWSEEDGLLWGANSMPMPMPMLMLGEGVSKLGSVAARGQERSQSQVSVPEVDSIETCNKREARAFLSLPIAPQPAPLLGMLVHGRLSPNGTRMEINKCGVCGTAGASNQRPPRQRYSMQLPDHMAPLHQSAPSCCISAHINPPSSDSYPGASSRACF
jgi:hypothetical protein